MPLELNDITRIAQLAHLEITPDAAEQTLNKLNNFFPIVDQMKAVDTEGIEPLSHPIAAYLPELALRLRADQVTQENQREAFQQCAPAVQDGLYLVPKVIE